MNNTPITDDIKHEFAERLIHMYLEYDMEYIAELALRALRAEIDTMPPTQLREEIEALHPDLLGGEVN